MFSHLFCLVYFCLVLNKTTSVESHVYPLVFKPCLFHNLLSHPSACLTSVRTSTKGLPFQLSMALCNDPHNDSAFSTHPCPCSGSACLMVLSMLASPTGTHQNTHWCLFVGHEQTRTARVSHPCQQAAAHLVCTRPRDCLLPPRKPTQLHTVSEPTSPKDSSFCHHSILFQHHGQLSPGHKQ